MGYLMYHGNLAMLKIQAKMKHFLEDEAGDTNFISMLVILAIVVVLIGVFLNYKDSIMGWVEEQMSGAFFEN